MQDFEQITWDLATEDECRQIIRLAVRGDLGREHDWTTVSLVGPEATGTANVVSRQVGVMAGLPAAQLAISELQAKVEWTALVEDGAVLQPGMAVAKLSGNARDLLTAERLVLNLLGRLCGIASTTAQYVDALGTSATRIYDTRKTTPGWRRMEKYAVRCGGGCNHRSGLNAAVLIKDNHLALGAQSRDGERFSPAEAVQRARAFVAQQETHDDMLVEVEVDTLEQLQEVLSVTPDIVLLDNMSPDTLVAAVAMRDEAEVATQLEASGGITLESIARVAATGVERISCGALTHSSIWLDLGLDWG